MAEINRDQLKKQAELSFAGAKSALDPNGTLTQEQLIAKMVEEAFSAKPAGIDQQNIIPDGKKLHIANLTGKVLTAPQLIAEGILQRREFQLPVKEADGTQALNPDGTNKMSDPRPYYTIACVSEEGIPYDMNITLFISRFVDADGIVREPIFNGAYDATAITDMKERGHQSKDYQYHAAAKLLSGKNVSFMTQSFVDPSKGTTERGQLRRSKQATFTFE